MSDQCVVEFRGVLYGPFNNSQAAEMWLMQQPSENPNAGKIIPLRYPQLLSPGEQQERALFPNGR